MAQAIATRPTGMNPLTWWQHSFVENTFNFSGRARRREYCWSAVVFPVVVALVLGGIAAITPVAQDAIIGVVVLGTLLAFLATWPVTVRRCHDGGSSGWILLLGLIPFIGLGFQLYLMFGKGDPSANKYGPALR